MYREQGTGTYLRCNDRPQARSFRAFKHVITHEVNEYLN